ncbi:EndoU domain-containing protein [Atopomonas hussainii]|uniref:EndoU domain-containing protein n=1 Tax=Atopomonas hussainii TaxID=1429083 RepID=UPI0009001888|nr:EndoU domain-containing protein [Atopomonas hussainii]
MHALHTLPLGLTAALFSLTAAAQIDCSAGAPGVNPVPIQVANAPIANSRINPQLNQRHIFCGEINGTGAAVGYHSRPNGHDARLGAAADAPLAARITAGQRFIVPPGNNHPAPYRYVANGIQVFNVLTNAWVNKAAPSTFFPDSCSQNEVVASVRYAYMHAYSPAGAPNVRFSGPSAPSVGAVGFCTGENGYPFTIGGYLNQIGVQWVVNSAFPVATF